MFKWQKIFILNLKNLQKKSDTEEDDIDVTKSLEKTQAEAEKALEEMHINDVEEEDKTNNKLFYKRTVRHYLADEVRKEHKEAVLTAAAYHKASKILITGWLTILATF